MKLVFPDGKIRITPDISERQTVAHASYINSCTKLKLNAQEASALLQKMGHRTALSPTDPDEIIVGVPATRPDILHECDLMEDAAIAYGFNNLPDVFPTTSTVAQPLAVSKLSDVIRREWALSGWVEVLPLILVREHSKVVRLLLILLRPTYSARTRKILNGLTARTITTRQLRSRTRNHSSFKLFVQHCSRVS